MKSHRDFNKSLLTSVHAEVKKRFPNLDLRSALVAMKTFAGRDWFVEGFVNGESIRWTGRAEDANHAKFQAWSIFLDRNPTHEQTEGSGIVEKPTDEQLAAIHRFAEKNGRTWKDKLNVAWMNGNDADLPDGDLLRQVRNQFGPHWLQGYTINEQKRKATAGAPPPRKSRSR